MDETSRNHRFSWVRRVHLLLLLILCGAASAWAMWSPTSPEDHVSSEVEQPSTSKTAPDTKNTSEQNSSESAASELPSEPVSPEKLTVEQMERIVVGNWTSQYYGTRHLRVREDGTATIYYQASTMARMFVGSKLEIQYRWEYDAEKHQVVFAITGGGPKKSLEYVKEMWGEKQRQTVEQISVNEMLLVDMDGETKHRWKSIEQIPSQVLALFDGSR